MEILAWFSFENLLGRTDIGFIHYEVIDNRPSLRSEHSVNSSVGGLDDEGVRRFILRIIENVSHFRPGLPLIRRNPNGQRISIPLIVVVINQDKMTIFQPNQIDGGVGIREFGIDTWGPGRSAVMRFRFHDKAVRKRAVSPPTTTEGDQMIFIKLHNRRLDISNSHFKASLSRQTGHSLVF